MSFRAVKVMPVLRIFSVEKAREFYLDYLGFQVDFEHRFDERAPCSCRFRATASCCASPSTTATARPERSSRST
jgi:hypothetical protein